eukprot:225481-Prymnesium_polylepis.2
MSRRYRLCGSAYDLIAAGVLLCAVRCVVHACCAACAHAHRLSRCQMVFGQACLPRAGCRVLRFWVNGSYNIRTRHGGREQ